MPLRQRICPEGFNVKSERGTAIGECIFVGVALAHYYAVVSKWVCDVPLGVFFHDYSQPPHVVKVMHV